MAPSLNTTVDSRIITLLNTEPLGKRYKLSVDRPDKQNDTEKVDGALHAVLLELKKSAATEVSS